MICLQFPFFGDLIILFKVIVFKSRDIHGPYQGKNTLRRTYIEILSLNCWSCIEMANHRCLERTDYDGERYRFQT